jgi:hypothetical protein
MITDMMCLLLLYDYMSMEHESDSYDSEVEDIAVDEFGTVILLHQKV